MLLTELMTCPEAFRQAIEMDDSGELAKIVAQYYLCAQIPPLKDSAVESPWLDSLLWLTAIARVNRVSPYIGTGYSGCRDLCVIEYILKRWNKKFSFGLRGNNTQRQEFRLQAEVLKNVIHCLEWFLGRGLSKKDARDMFVEIFYEEGLTPYCGYYAETISTSTKRESIKSIQSENRRLMKVADDFENPFDKNLMPSTYRFTEICNTQSGKSDDFRKQHWYPLVKARKAWTTFYIKNGTILTIDHEKNKVKRENRGRSKNKK